MPELALPDLHLTEAGTYLFAVMLFPRDPDRHVRFVQSVQNTVVRKILRGANPDRVVPDAMSVVVSAAAGPSLEDEVRQAAAHLMGPGYPRPMMAALTLAYVLGCAEAREKAEPATLEHARRMIATAGGTRASLPGVARSYLINLWRDFSPAVHLWAIKLLFPELWKNSSCNGAALAEFLAYAEELRRRGETHRPPRSRSPLLDPSESWLVPSRFDLPAITLELPTPSEMREQMAKWSEVQKTLDPSAELRKRR